MGVRLLPPHGSPDHEPGGVHVGEALDGPVGAELAQDLLDNALEVGRALEELELGEVAVLAMRLGPSLSSTKRPATRAASRRAAIWA